MTKTTSRTYTELRRLRTFEDRYKYLRLRGSVGRPTFAFDRYLNQRFYGSKEWSSVRQFVIARDEARDLGMDGFDIHDRILIHHMNPFVADDLKHRSEELLDPEFLICTTHRTHNAIHFGDESLLLVLPKERRPGDTKLW